MVEPDHITQQQTTTKLITPHIKFYHKVDPTRILGKQFYSHQKIQPFFLDKSMFTEEEKILFPCYSYFRKYSTFIKKNLPHVSPHFPPYDQKRISNNSTILQQEVNYNKVSNTQSKTLPEIRTWLTDKI